MKWNIAKRIKGGIREQLLYNRGIKREKKIEDFFNPKLLGYRKDLELSGIKEARKRILEAKEKNELVVIYGDYDVDGICASAILYKALSLIGVNVMPFIPLRGKHGYGLSAESLREIKEKYAEAKLIITVDNGIVAMDESRVARELGFDLIITDHHIAGDRRPEALAIIHSAELSGSGVAWCLARALVDEQHLGDLLQFACIGTIADSMQLLGVNRAIVVEGLWEINHTTNVGLRSLVKVSALELGGIGTFEVGFMLAPRLNAAGRLGSALPSLRLLCTNNEAKARLYAGELNDANAKRQLLLSNALEEAKVQLKDDDLVNVVRSDHWIPGIVGLVAARICEMTGKASLAIALDGDNARGSARSVPEVDIVELLRKVEGVFDSLGGHKGAAGFGLSSLKIDLLCRNLSRITSEMNLAKGERILKVDMEIGIDDIDMKLARLIEEFAPFGSGNPAPIFVSRGLEIADIKTVGGGKHLKFRAGGIEVIYFGGGNLVKDLERCERTDLAYHLEINKFNGSRVLQMRVKDIRVGPFLI